MYNCTAFKDGDAVAFVLAVSRGYPSEKYPGNGVFEFDQAKALVKTGCKGFLLPIRRSKGLDRQFKNGTVGCAVNPKSPEDITDKILKTIKNYESISKNYLDLCNKFRWDDIVKRYCDVYYRILSVLCKV